MALCTKLVAALKKWNSTTLTLICQAFEIETLMSFVIFEVMLEASELFLNRRISLESGDRVKFSLKDFIFISF